MMARNTYFFKIFLKPCRFKSANLKTRCTCSFVSIKELNRAASATGSVLSSLAKVAGVLKGQLENITDRRGNNNQGSKLND
jgi:hypothetical protein